MTNRVAIPRLDSRGLDFNNLSGISPEEIRAFQESYRTEDGSSQSGFDFLIENNPAALKTYRFFATQIQPPYLDPRFMAGAFGWLGYYAYLDFDEGVRYSVVPLVRAGYTRDQVMEGMSIVFMCGGTRALVTVGRALKEFQWPQTAPGAVPWPQGWTPDPGAFNSGLDFSTPEVLPGEVERIIAWYERVIGWVPTWVTYFARHNQAALKGWRYRYENAIVTLPHQVLPLSFITSGLLFQQRELVRENILLARSFGVALDDVLQVIDLTAVYGTEPVALAYDTARDVLDNWD